MSASSENCQLFAQKLTCASAQVGLCDNELIFLTNKINKNGSTSKNSSEIQKNVVKSSRPSFIVKRYSKSYEILLEVTYKRTYLILVA